MLDFYYNVKYENEFDFSAVSTVGDIDENFSQYCNSQIQNFINNYNFKFDLNKTKSVHSNLNELFVSLSLTNPEIKIYILIDEYDNLINNLLMTNKANYKEFFKSLKSLTNKNDSLFKKMFFTGVSPLALFDVISEFNIVHNIRNNFVFNDIVGITEKEFKELRDYYEMDFDEDNLRRLANWYGHYKFNDKVEHTIYNTNMYFILYR